MSVSSSPRGEKPGKPGAQWDTELRTSGEHVIPDDAPQPRANRAARRAAARAARSRQRPRLQIPAPKPSSENELSEKDPR